MSSSPYASTSPREATLLKESTSRYHERYNERFRLLSSTPPRDVTKTKTTISPSRSTCSPSTTDTKPALKEEIIPVKYNSSPGSPTKKEIQEPKREQTTSTSPFQAVSISNRASSPQQPTQKEVREQKYSVPKYMQATKSYSNKVQSKKETHKAEERILGPREKGGVTKRVGTSKIPRYQSTTAINAIEEIKNQMAPEDTYIPLAARIQLFEKGLRNGSKPPAPVVSKYSSTSTIRSGSPASTPMPTPVRSKVEPSPHPRSSISSASSSQGKTSKQLVSNAPSSTNSVPHYALQTTQSIRRQRDKKSTEQPTNPTKTFSKEPKPFHFATDAFRAKLDMWKQKDKQATIENQKNMLIHRKRKREAEEGSARNSKQKYH